LCLVGDVMICWISTAGRLFYAVFIEEYIITGAKGFFNLFLKMTANVVSVVIVSYPIVEKGTPGWGCFKASVVS
jgi:hypothetical protein